MKFLTRCGAYAKMIRADMANGFPYLFKVPPQAVETYGCIDQFSTDLFGHYCEPMGECPEDILFIIDGSKRIPFNLESAYELAMKLTDHLNALQNVNSQSG